MKGALTLPFSLFQLSATLAREQACLQVLRIQTEHQLPQVRDRGRQRYRQRQRGRDIHQLAHAQQPAPGLGFLVDLGIRFRPVSKLIVPAQARSSTSWRTRSSLHQVRTS